MSLLILRLVKMKEYNLLQTYEIFLKIMYFKLLQEYLNNEIIGFTDCENNEETAYYTVTDIQGSITEVYDNDSNLVWKSGYTAFGEIAGETVDLIDFDGMYTGCDYDAETGLTYHWNRWRSEDGSAFISEDPARDGANWYGYAGCNPMVYVDRIGLAQSNDYLAPGVAGPQPKPQNQENGFVPLVQNPSGMPQNQTPNIPATPNHVAGFSEQYGNYNVLPKYKGIETGDKWYNSLFEGIVNYGIIGTYNLCATAINTISNGVGAAYDLINATSETVLGGDLDAITMTMMSNGMLAPAGYMLNGFNSYMNGLKLSNTSKLGNAALNLGQGVVNTGASLVGVDGAFINGNSQKRLFWSGFGDGGIKAEKFARKNGMITLEMTLVNPPSFLENPKFWKDASANFASTATGDVTALLVSDFSFFYPGKNVFKDIEVDILLTNPNVTTINLIW